MKNALEGGPMNQLIGQLATQSTTLAQIVMNLAVVDADSFAEAGAMSKTVTLYIRRVGEVMEPIVEAAYATHKIAVQQRDTLLKPAQGAKRMLGERMGAYEQEQARIRQEAERLARQEQERLEAEERSRVAVEEARLRTEAEEWRLAEAVAAEQTGDKIRAQALIDTPIVVAPVALRPVFVPPPPMVAPAVEGVSFHDVWDFEIINEVLIPRDFLLVDEVKIRRVVKAMKGQTAIPGVRAFARRVTTIRTP